jgi:hypothetical protein
MSQVDARPIAQVNVEKDAERVSEITVVCESLRRRKQHARVAELPQQSRYAPQHRGIVIDDENKVPVWRTNIALDRLLVGARLHRHDLLLW